MRGIRGVTVTALSALVTVALVGLLGSQVPTLPAAAAVTPTWQTTAGYTPLANVSAVSCAPNATASTTTCVAVGYGYTPRRNGTDTLYGLSELTSTSGRHWAESTVAKAQALFADSCVVKTRDCIAGGETSAGAVILKSANDGVTWTSEPLPRA